MTQSKPKVTIGAIAAQLLKAGKSAEETLAAVKRVFPECQTTMKCIYYYASKANVQLRAAQAVDRSELAKVLAELEAA